VGRPLLETLRRFHGQVVGYDIKPSVSEGSVSQCVTASDCAIFIVQTPSKEDGSFSNDYLLSALRAFKAAAGKQGKDHYLFIVTSTTVPGSCEEFSKIVGKRLVYNPLFIRLEFIDEDLLNPSFLLFGASNPDYAIEALSIYRPITACPSITMTWTEAELAKITLNCALTAKISLANQLYLVAERMGCNPKKIMQAVGMDPRIGQAYLTPGWPFSGPCLPRDGRMFQYVADKAGTDAPLAAAVDEINNRMYRAIVRKK
jgi:UDPglucose 6-dehydrogenase